MQDESRAQLMSTAANILTGVDITELYSLVRVVRIAENMGLMGGLSMDLRTGWDFESPVDRDKARSYVRRVKPLVIIGSLPCTMFSILLSLNWGDHRSRMI